MSIFFTEYRVIFLWGYSVPTPTHIVPKTCLAATCSLKSKPQISQIINSSPLSQGNYGNISHVHCYRFEDPLCLVIFVVSHELCYACQRIFAIFFNCFIVRYFSGFLVYNIARKSHLHFTFDYMMGWRLFKSINLLLYGICHQWHAYHQTSLLCLGMLFPYQDYLLMHFFVYIS